MNPELLELIDDYLAGKLSKAALEKQTRQFDISDLEQEIQWYKESKIAIERIGLKNQLESLFDKPAPKTNQPTILRRLYVPIAVAASVLILITGYWMINRTSTPSLYAEFQYVDPGLPVLMSQSEQYELYDALSYYSEEDYPTASEKLSLLQQKNPSNDTINYYLGASLLYQGKAALATSAFEQVLLVPNSGYLENTQWLRILTELQQQELTMVQQLLPTILNNRAHPFYEEATELDRRLKEE